jgi:hypothetical protein
MMGRNDTSARYVGTATGTVRDVFLPPVRNGVEFQGRASKFDRTREKEKPRKLVVALTAGAKHNYLNLMTIFLYPESLLLSEV